MKILWNLNNLNYKKSNYSIQIYKKISINNSNLPKLSDQNKKENRSKNKKINNNISFL
jgi:hypothetical protein